MIEPEHLNLSCAAVPTGAPREDQKPALSARSESQDQSEDEKEKAAIIAALDECKWNRSSAAKLLGMSYPVLRYRMKKYDIDT